MATSTNVLNLPGYYIIRARNGTITLNTPLTIAEEDLLVRGNTELGTSSADTINPIAQFINDLYPQSSDTYNIGTVTNTWKTLNVENFVTWRDASTAIATSGDGTQETGYKNIINNLDNPGNPYTAEGPNGRPYDPGVYGVYGSAEQRERAALYVRGGVGIEKDLNVGGFIYGRVELANTSTFMYWTATNVNQDFNISFVLQEDPEDNQSPVYIDNTGAANGLVYNPAQGKLTTDRALIAEGDNSTSTTTGALIVNGGVGIAKNAYVGGILTATDVMPKADNTGTIGSTDTNWAQAYVQELYTRVIGSTTGTVTINPAAGVTDIIGDIRVRGTNPIGTAPVVTNTLYVTMDGDDTNDGRAMDPSRACRTISGAVNSPYFQPGTQIRVSPGFYLEDNPIRLKPYTSVMGSDIRTTFIEPINKTQDLFHVDSGCYIAFCTFLNGRSGLLEGDYAEGFNRGAYCTAFPPLEGTDRIDLYHSPYIQNCTNQSGPWLKDGTMFVPNQTIQVPQAVARGSWDKGTSTIVVELVEGTAIERGMKVNSGMQNPGFFDARTLMLANKPFLQEQVVAFVDQTFNTGTFIYDTVKCARDVGLIVDSISIDMLTDSISDSIFAGLQYWRQSGYVDAVGDQITTTTAAISYVKTLAQSTASSAGGSTASAIVGARFDDILLVLNTSTATLVTGAFSQWVTDEIALYPNSTATSTATIIAAYDALLAAKESIATQTIAYINSSTGAFSYDQAKCARDTALIIDAIAQDLLFDGVTQSTFAGLQYWDQGALTGTIPLELTTTTNAILFVRDLSKKVVLGDTSGTRYQTVESQITNTNSNYTTATTFEANLIGVDFDQIVYILNTGTTGVTDNIIPNGIEASTTASVINAYNLLQANKDYIKAEAIAYVEATKTGGFTYDQTKCARDVGYMLDSVSFDLLYGGNKQAIQSGVYYYTFNGSSTAIPGEIPQTTAAYNYIRELLPNIIRSQAISTSTLYQSSEVQVLGTPGTPIEVDEARERVDLIVNIINNGPSVVVDELEPISLNRSTNEYVIAAARLLKNNRDFFASEIVAYVNTLKAFVFDEDKCRRDIGYMIDSVAFDLLHGGRKQSLKSGVYYFGYTDTTEIPQEIPQTAAAYQFIKSLLSGVIKAEPIANLYQNIIVQDTTTWPAGTDNEVELTESKIDVITRIIRQGPDVAPDRVPISTPQNGNTNYINAYLQLQENKDFIKAEVIAYLNTFGNFEYSREFCFRDVGILVENVSYDASFGGNEKTVESGLAYYDGVVSLIAGQESQTSAAIDYLNTLVQKVITNTTCTDLLSNGTSTTATYVQVINTVLNGQVASDSVTSLFDTIITIINNGPTSAPEVYRATNVDAAYVAAETLIQANRAFIQQDTINYINNITLDFPYSEIKCRRDTGLIVDSIADDLLFYTEGFSQSTFAGLQYWNQDGYIGDIEDQLAPTVAAVEYLKDLAIKVIQNITPADDLVTRYQNTFTQVTNLEPASLVEVGSISANFDIIIDIVNGNSLGWTDRIISNQRPTGILSVKNAVELLQANKQYMGHEVTAFVDATNDNFVYDSDKCRRDVGHMIDAICFDLENPGNRQSVQTGLYYYGFNTSTITIRNQEMQTTNAFLYLATLTNAIVKCEHVPPLQTRVNQYKDFNNVGTEFEASILRQAVSTITNIINVGPSVNYDKTAIAFTASSTASVFNAYNLLKANRDFIIEEVIAYIDQTYNPNAFNYDEALCYRDTGLIVDAVSQDILLQGNHKSIEAGLAYWNYGVSHVVGQETTTTMAINHARDLCLQIAANQEVIPQTGTVLKQVINPFFQYGGDYMPRQAIRRNFDIVTTIINRGPLYAPPKFLGGGLFALTGLNGSDVLLAPEVISVSTLTSSTYLVGLSTSTIGFGNNATLYFGETLTFPYRDYQVDELSYEFTGNTSTWALRKIDKIGGMGGSLVDGGVISDRSPIQSFVYDAFTQLTQGGRGIHIIRNGYAQLVSVFTIFASVGVQTDSGGIASIVNSNANFGDIVLLAKGYGKRKFSGQIYNPPFKAFPESPDLPGGDYFDQYYPNGFWPNNAQVAVYLPDTADRPHISLVMELVPPDDYLNEQNLPGFLNASPTTSTLTTGTITLRGIDNTNVAIGNQVFVRDQFGFTTSTVQDSSGNWIPYCATGTIVTDVGYDSITLSNALPSGGGEVDNPNFFDFYFCGNAYYTVLSSEVIQGPEYNAKKEIIPMGINILSTASTGGDVSQVPAHVAALQYMNSLTISIINNQTVVSLQTGTSTSTQTKLPLVRGGGDAQSFIDLRYGEIIDIVNAPDLVAAEAVIKPSLRTTTGPAVQGGGNAITLIEANIDFIADEIAAFVDINFSTSTFTYDETTCRRDAGYILDGAYYDIALGSNWNAVYSGIAYRRSVSSVVTASQLTQTIGAVTFLRERAETYMTGSTTATVRVGPAFDEVLNILAEGEAQADLVVYPRPNNMSENDNKWKANRLLLANKEFMKAEIVAWINAEIAANNPPFNGFTYDSATCARDVGYLVDSLAYDVLYGGNWASIISARAYFENAVTVIPGETSQTVAAYQRLSTVAQQVVQGLTVTVSSGNTVMQNTSLPAASAAEATVVDNRLQIVEDVINAGSLSGLPAVSQPDITWTDSALQAAVNALDADQTDILNDMIVYINDEFVGSFSYDREQCKRDVETILQRLIYDIQTGGRYNSVMCGLAYWHRTGTYHKVQLGENVTRTDLFPHNATVNFYQRSYQSASGYVFEYCGAGIDYGALPQRGVADPVQSKETVQLNSGKVFFTSTDQNGDFRIGPGLVISQATGVLSGRTFTRSLFANLTPFILAIEAGAG